MHQPDDEVDRLGRVQRAVALALAARRADGVEDERLSGCHGRAPFADSAGLGCPGRLHNNTTARKARKPDRRSILSRRARVPARDQRESGAYRRRRGRADRRDRARHRRPLAADPARLRLLGARARRPALQPARPARDEGRRAAARPAARRRRARRSASRRAWARRSRRSACSRSRSAGAPSRRCCWRCWSSPRRSRPRSRLCIGCQVFAGADARRDRARRRSAWSARTSPRACSARSGTARRSRPSARQRRPLDGLRHARAWSRASTRRPRWPGSGCSTRAAPPRTPAWRWPPRWRSLSPMMTGPGGDAFLLYREAATGARARAGGRGPGRPRGDRRGDARAGPRRHAGARRRADHRARAPSRCGRTRPPSSGRLGLAALLAPAREIAERGFPVAPSARACGATRRRRCGATPPRPTAFLPGGRAPREGELVRLPDLARTLGTIAERGPARVLRGRDRRADRRRRRAPPAASSSSRTWPRTARPGSSRSARPTAGWRSTSCRRRRPAIAALMILRALEREDLGALDPLRRRADPPRGRGRREHAFAALHEHVGDPDVRRRARSRSCSPAPRRRRERRARRRAAATGDTTYLCAVDAEGNGCSLINSLYKGFGSGVVAPGTGVCLHDRGFGFSLDPALPVRARAGQAAAAHDHPGARHARRGAVGGLREHGRLHAAAGPRPGAGQPARPRHGAAGGRRPPAPLPRRAASCSSRAACPRPRSPSCAAGATTSWSGRPTPSRRAARRSCACIADGVRAAGSDPRKDGCALAQ